MSSNKSSKKNRSKPKTNEKSVSTTFQSGSLAGKNGPSTSNNNSDNFMNYSMDSIYGSTIFLKPPDTNDIGIQI